MATQGNNDSYMTPYPEQDAEIDALRRRLLLIVDFAQQVDDFPSGDRIRDLVNAFAVERNVRGLRLLSRDMDEKQDRGGRAAWDNPEREGAKGGGAVPGLLENTGGGPTEIAAISRILQLGR